MPSPPVVPVLGLVQPAPVPSGPVPGGSDPPGAPRPRVAVRLLLVRVLLVLVLLAVLPGGTRPAAATPLLPAAASWPVGTPQLLRGFDPPGAAWSAGHRGVDLAARPGETVLAAAAGRVAFAGSVAGRGVVSVDHGGVRTTYEPVTATVRAGDPVRLGDPLGVVSTGGHCAGRCLHWGLRSVGGDDRYLDPLLLLGGAAGRVRLVPQASVAEVARAVAAREAAARDAAGSLAAGAPAPGPHGFALPVPGGVSSSFGMRLHPVLHVWRLHDGTDLAAACGTPIRAPAAGRVRSVSASPAYGNRLSLDHGRRAGRTVLTGYNHAAHYVVAAGQRVRASQVIGYVGSTGRSTGCHLHLMLWLGGRLTDPMRWFG